MYVAHILKSKKVCEHNIGLSSSDTVYVCIYCVCI